MNPKFLVVNADDLGFSHDMNAAIEELHRAGRISNTSLMVDGDCLDEAMAIVARNPKLGIGLHLDLAAVIGFKQIPYEEMRANLRQPEAQAAVVAEVTRQITRYKELGLEFTHLDGHRHFHALPELFEVVIETAVAHGLKTVRLTNSWLLPRTPSVFWDEGYLRRAEGLLARHGVRYVDRFVYGCNEYGAGDFVPGWNELMVHVGYDDEFYSREYRLLASDAFARILKESAVELKTYRDLAQQSAGRN